MNDRDKLPKAFPSLQPHEQLPYCWTCHTGPAAFIRSRPIDSKKSAEAFFAVAKQLDKDFKTTKKNPQRPLRLMASQLAKPETEWDAIATEHLWLTWLGYEHGLSAQMKHLLLPSPPLYTLKRVERESEFFQRAVDRLALMHNIDAWESYCFWMTEEIEQLIAWAQYDAIDFYTLEAHFKDFIIEERANILRQTEWDVQGLILKLGALRKEFDFPLVVGEDTFSIEKKLMQARSETKQRLTVQYGILKEIARIIGIIEKAHPELLRLKRKAQLLSLLMGSHLGLEGVPSLAWEQQLMVMQLLHEELDIITGLNCSTGMERTSLAFAVQEAISLIKQAHGVDSALDLALHWEEEGELANPFREIVVAVLDQLCAPLSERHPSAHWHEERIENPLYLSLLPRHAHLHNPAGNLIHAHLLQPDGLTKAGHYLMTRLFEDGS